MRSGAILALGLLVGCLEAPPASLDGGPAVEVDAFPCTGACCGSPASGFTDDFEDGVPGPWFTFGSDPGCVVDEREGGVHLSNSVADTGCYYELRGLLLAGGQTASIELVDPGDGEPNAEFRLELGSTEKVSFERTAGGLRVTHRSVGGGTQIAKQPISYLPESHRFLRFRGGIPGENVLLETSGNGADWAFFFDYEFEAPGGDDCVEFELGTFGPAGTTEDDEVVFDNFNRFP